MDDDDTSSNAPLLLVEGSTSDGNFRLQKKNLSKLVGFIENLPVSVVTVAGPPKTGKSLLFGYLVRYFIAAEKDEIDWIDSDNHERVLDEIKWPRDGKSPDNPGIWSYHRPFLLENDDGPKPGKIAVILLYTQSSDKYAWDRDDNESCSLIGLTLHISSNIIFNVYKYIDEECLATIATSIKYALTTGSQPSPIKKGKSPQLPFQSSCFVIRDWNFPSEYQYGMKGGRDFVKIEKLKENQHHSRDSRENRQLINGLFQDVSGCLLPFPGSAVIQPEDFQGSIGEMGIEFSKHLTDLINSQVNIDQMVMKNDVMGKAVTGKTWKEMIERYVNGLGDTDVTVVDTGKILRRFRIKVTSTPNEQRECIKPALKAYADVWKKYQKGGKVFDDKALRDIQKRAKKKAVATFEKEVCGQGEGDDDDDLGSSDEDEQPQVDEKVKRQLLERITKRFMDIQKEEDNKQKENMERYKVDILQQYRDTMISLFSNSSRPPAEKTFRRESKNTIENLEAEFMEKIGAADGDRRSLNEKQEVEMENLTKRLKEVEEEMFGKIFTHEGIDEDSRSSIHRSNDSAFDTLKPPSHFSPIRISNSLNRSTSSLSSRRSDTSIDEAGSLFQERFARKDIPTKSSSSLPSRESKEAQRKQEANMKSKSKQLVERLTELHISEFDSKAEDIEADLDDIHDESMAKIMQKFEYEIPYDKTRSEYSLYKGILEADCKSALNSVKSKIKRIKKNKQSALETAKKSAIENYERRLEDFLANNEDATMSELQQTSGEIEEDVVKTLRGKVGRGQDDAIEITKQEMADIFVKFQNKLELKRQKFDNQSGTDFSEFKMEYNQKMKNAPTSVRNEKELEQTHKKVTDELIAKLKRSGGSKPHIQELESTLDSLYIIVKEKMNLQKRHALGAANLSVRHAREYYTKEMEKKISNHRNMSHDGLQKLHQDMCKTTLKKFPDADKREVENMLKIAFRRFQDEVSMNSSDEPAIGIDLGTTYSCVALYQKGKVEILPNSIGKYTTPSYVLFKTSGGEIVGEEAKTRAYENPEGTIFDAKRILGRRFDDPKLQDDMKLWPFSVVDGGRGVPMIEVNGKRLNPEIISSKILKQLKKDSEDYLKRKVSKAVVTVPAYFTDGQKQATIDAGKMAGLEVLSILTEPVAAAMAYKLQYSDTEDEDRHILVFDLGGGTFDVAVLKASRGKLDVLTVDGDTHLGGEDFDKNMMNYCAQEFKKQHGIDLFEGKDSPKKNVRDDVRRRLKRLQAVCEMQKIALTTARSTDVSVDNIYKNMDLEVTVTRAAFENINKPLFDKTIKVVQDALKSAKLDKSKINDIVMVGGSTRIPKVQQLLKDYFNGKELDKKINPDEAVAHGAGLMAAIKQGSVGQTSSAYTKIQDVTPMSIGVEVYGGGFSPIIPKSTKTPVMLKERYKTAHNNQTSVQITIYEGEDKIAQKNKHLGDFYLNGIPPNLAGVENIDVEMVINDQGILHVTAKCSSTGTKSTVTVTENKQRMGPAAIKRYLAEAGA